MNGFRSACIISRPKENVKAAKIQGFFKWIGISYVTLTSRENDICKNLVLKENRESLDVTIYLRENETVFYNWSSNPFRKVVEFNEKQNTTTEIVSSILNELYKTVTEDHVDADNTVFGNLIEIYEKYDLAAELANINYSLRSNSDVVLKDYNEQRKKWIDVINDLEKLQQKAGENGEYLKHAFVYSKRKVNELCNLQSFARTYSVFELLEEADEIYQYDKDFYEAECLKSKIALLDSEYQLLSTLYLQGCIEQCPVAACRSFYYYRLGKQYEGQGRKDRAIEVYEKAYKTNPANIRAIFKLGVHYINKKELKLAEKYFSKILELLGLINIQDEQMINQINELSAIELEYASKSYILLIKIARLDDQGIRYEKYLHEQAEKIANSLDGNLYLQKMYSDELQRSRVKDCLQRKLSLDNIRRRFD